MDKYVVRKYGLDPSRPSSRDWEYNELTVITEVTTITEEVFDMGDFRKNDKARLGRGVEHGLYVEFPQESDDRTYVPDLGKAKQLMEKHLKHGDDSRIVELRNKHIELRRKFRNIEHELADVSDEVIALEDGMTVEESKWLDVLIADTVRKMSPEYVHPYSTKLGRRPDIVAIAEWYDRDKSGVKGDSILDFGISVHWGQKPE